MEIDLRRTIDEHPMSHFQIIAVIVCVVLNMLDGFDVLAVAFSASHLSSDWHLGGKEIGLLFSAGLFGMASGSLFLAPLADRFGRRKLVLGCLVMIAFGMLASAAAQNLVQLIALRALTGLGIGAMVASIAVIASEYSSNRWRSGAISMQSAGYSLGATVGGAVSAYLLTHFGWRSVFVFGGLSTAVVIPFVLYFLPESLAFLLVRRPSSALERVNGILLRMGRDSVDTLPKVPSAQASSQARDLSGNTVATANGTVYIWASFFFVMGAFYFVMSWTPKLLVEAGMSAVQGVTGGVLLNAGGILGCTLFSLLSARVSVVRLLATTFVASAILIAVFGAASSSLVAAMIVAVFMGAAISACVGGLFSITPRLFEPGARATGVGRAVGMGRIGSMVGPCVAGALIDIGWKAPQLYYAFCSAFLLGLVFVLCALKAKEAQAAVFQNLHQSSQ
jgi:benzoate transport